MRVRGAAVALVLLAGCGVTRGPLLVAVDAGVASDAGSTIDGAAGSFAGAGGTAGTPPALIAQDAPWQYQLVGTVDTDLDVKLFVIDLFNVSESAIARLHAQNKIAVAYLSAGTLESFRNDRNRFPAAAVGRALLNYPDESWLDVRDPTVRAQMAARLDLAREKGFDGVLPTNLSAYRFDSGFDLTAADQADYSAWLADQARARGLRVGMTDDFTRLEELGPHFDFGVQFGCIARGDCAVLDPFRAQGKTVLDVETEGTREEVCQRAAEFGVNAILKRPSLDGNLVGCP